MRVCCGPLSRPSRWRARPPPFNQPHLYRSATCGIKGECYAPNKTSCPATLVLSCGTGTFTGVKFASYGTPLTGAGNCSFSAGACDAPSSAAVVAAACVGRSACAIDVGVSTFGPDPCGGVYKFLAVEMEGACAPAPAGALCALSTYSRTFRHVNASGTGQSYYQKLMPRNDAPAPRTIPYALNPPTGGVTLNGGVLGAASDAAVKYLLNVYTVDNLLFNFRKRAGLPQPPGAHCMGWDCQADWCVRLVTSMRAQLLRPLHLLTRSPFHPPPPPPPAGLRAPPRGCSSWARAGTCGGARSPRFAP